MPATVRSSDLADWQFCAIKFFYERVQGRAPVNARARDASRAAGTAAHAAHDAAVSSAASMHRLARAVSLAGLAALALMLLLGLAACSASAVDQARNWTGAGGAGMIVLALVLHAATASLQRRTQIPASLRVLSSDAGLRRGQLLRDDRLGLVGRPDYIFSRRSGVRTRIFTAEAKSRPTPRRPFRGHVLQTAASIHLARSHYGRRASRSGYLVYADSSVEVELTRALTVELENAVAAVRSILTSPSTPSRNHASQRRCSACSFAAECPASLLH
jgi:CRISPR/Cas system-associated exonuclease Cas4 (RecB family)